MISFNYMVEYTIRLDSIFASLADPTRRDILSKVAKEELSVGTIAKAYPLTFAAVSKHLGVLERASLITKKRHGKEQIVSLAPTALKDADHYLRRYEKIWDQRLDRLDALLKGGATNE